MLDIQITHHALARIRERGIKKKQALKLLRAATLSYRKPDGTIVYRNEDLKFVVIEYPHFWRLLTVAKRDEEILL